MQKYLALWLGMFLFSGITMAQVASGNVAESSNPRSDVINAQNVLAQRTIAGCVVQRGAHYLLVPRHGRPEEMTSVSAENLGQIVGHQVKATGLETYAGEGAHPDADYAVAVERIEMNGQSCSANWNAKLVGRFSGMRP